MLKLVLALTLAVLFHLGQHTSDFVPLNKELNTTNYLVVASKDPNK